ncbi:hypothetical protein [Clostridium ihumii]|uniref:hypothetical protein n=1 Tax=Clostridium ihumii TaxID=1470356 RepID=UPI0005524C2C|nr:hypothetical protein [Clostridium ihumii]
MPNYKDFDLDIQNNKGSSKTSLGKELSNTGNYYDPLSECRCKPKTYTKRLKTCNVKECMY